MNEKPKDRHLDVPAEANRDKHVNFVAQEKGEKDPGIEQPENSKENREPNKRSDDQSDNTKNSR